VKPAAGQEAESSAAARRSARILEEVVAVAERFLRAPYESDRVEEMLERLGRASEASRSYLFVLRAGPDGETLADQTLEWVDAGCEPQRDNPQLQGFSFRATGNAWLHERLAAGETVAGPAEELPEPLRGVMREKRILSVLLTPVHVRGEFWGFLGYDDRRQPRPWSEAEVGALRLAASVLAAAVERREAERSLRESEERYRELFENSSDAIWATDRDGRFVALNRRAARLLGRRRAEVLGHSWEEFIDPEQRRAAAGAAAGEESQDATGWFELRIDRPDEEPSWVEIRARPRVEDGRLVGYQGTGRDVTERRRLRERLSQAERMEAWGRLAAGLARDFDGLMTTIRGFGEQVAAQLRPSDPMRAEVSEILLAAERAAELTRDLVALGRQQPALPERLDAAAWLERRLPMLRRLVGEGVELGFERESGETPVDADPQLLEQAVVTLVLWLRDGMAEGGRIEIAVRAAAGEDVARRGAPEEVARRYAHLEIADDGPGIDAETAGRLFEPFFQMEGQSGGRGLGLSAVYGIVRQCGGFVFAGGRPERGTVLDIYLPLVDEDAAAVEGAASAIAEPAAPGGAPTVLLVEDEDLIRSLAEQILSERGYRVLAAANASEAIETASRHASPIDLLLTDVVMPGSSGTDLAHRLLRQHPEMKVLYMSGYSDSLVFRFGVLQERSAFLQKPFSAELLESKVRELIGR